MHHLLLSVDAAADASWVDPPLAVPTDGVHRGEVRVRVRVRVGLVLGSKVT